MIRVEATYNGYGQCTLRAFYPDGEPVTWITLPYGFMGQDSVRVEPGPFFKMRVKYRARKLRALGEKFHAQGQTVKTEEILG